MVVVAAAVVSGCSSSTPQAIPDPGGLFKTSVPANTSLGALTADQAGELCMEFQAADHSYLVTGVTSEEACREIAFELTGTPANYGSDGGTDGGSFLTACQGAYDQCKQQAAGGPGLVCFFPISGCGATVELFSACMNEIANSDPIASCVTTPTCAAAAAAGTLVVDAGGSETACTTGQGAPPLPACDRLSQECPNVGIYDPYCPFVAAPSLRRVF